MFHADASKYLLWGRREYSLLLPLPLMLGNIGTGCSVMAPAAMLYRIIGRARRQHPHRGPADHFRRGGVVRRLAPDDLA
jgi:hypothetical protein